MIQKYGSSFLAKVCQRPISDGRGQMCLMQHTHNMSKIKGQTVMVLWYGVSYDMPKIRTDITELCYVEDGT